MYKTFVAIVSIVGCYFFLAVGIGLAGLITDSTLSRTIGAVIGLAVFYYIISNKSFDSWTSRIFKK